MRPICMILSVLAICLALGVPAVPAHADGPAGVTASVRCMPIRKGVMEKTVSAYGIISPSPGTVKDISAAYQARIKAVYVTEGQVVGKADRLLDVSPGPDTILALKEMQLEMDTAEKGLELAKERFSLRLATNQDVLNARKAFDQARTRLDYMKSQGADRDVIIKAPSDGMVNKIFVSQGAVVQAGSPLLEVMPKNGQEVKLEVEPEDACLISQGQKALISFVNRSCTRPMTGRVRAVSSMVNPATRLLDVFVSLPENQAPMLNEYVKGEIKIFSRSALIVPRDAVLPQNGHFVLFTVENGRAKRHIVGVGLEKDGEVQITGGGLSAGEMAVVLGNYELKDGMAVRVEGSR